ncbi:MAG: NUDIX domain-containing protein [Candidatus Gracilibacteria bacterium]
MSHMFEQSAGGIVYRKHGGLIEVLLLKWKNSGGNIVYALPKGHLLENETAADAAIREIVEETGLEASLLKIKKFIKTISFSFTARHKTGSPTINKDVALYLVEYSGAKKPYVQREERFVGSVWLTLPDLKKVKTKPNIYDIVEANKDFM